ncbi:hypothetical protein [Amycolatopsis nigrescens]|uniref:hypothetical protein n=1 Tax=Amycolatopsis nigrescens TaxID=381445 RepID=UPI00037A3FC6|nr:hypothetical protein [Amycolatopsis nigrescens]
MSGADLPGYQDNAALKGFGGYEPASYAATTGTPVPAPASEPPKPKRRRSKAPYGLLAVVVLLGLGYVGSRSTSRDEVDAPAPSTSSATSYTPRPKVVVPPAVAGWQSVAGRDGLYAYDVPPGWTPKPDTVHGWNADANGPGITLVASAFTGQEYCPTDKNRDRGGSGVAPVAQRDYALAAAETVTLIAKQAYTAEGGPQPALAVGSPEPAQIDDGAGGKRNASVTVAEVTVAGNDKSCMPPRALVGAIAIEPGDQTDAKSPVLVAYFDQAYPGETTREQLAELLRSYRIVPESSRTTVSTTN